jgi:hypothetical protein
MSDIVDISDLQRAFQDKKSKKDLELFAQAQYDLINRIQEENQILRQKVESLEKMLMQSSSVLSINVSPEEEICVHQIELIRSKSRERSLSLDEIKQLDLLVKNLRLIREKSTEILDDVSYRDIKEADLVSIATRQSEEDQ